LTRAIRSPDLLGTYHLTAHGETSWHGFARAIVSSLSPAVTVLSIRSSEYPRVARRPRYSVLGIGKFTRAFDVQPPEWITDLEQVLEQLRPSV